MAHSCMSRTRHPHSTGSCRASFAFLLDFIAAEARRQASYMLRRGPCSHAASVGPTGAGSTRQLPSTQGSVHFSSRPTYTYTQPSTRAFPPHLGALPSLISLRRPDRGTSTGSGSIINSERADSYCLPFCPYTAYPTEGGFSCLLRQSGELYWNTRICGGDSGPV